MLKNSRALIALCRGWMLRGAAVLFVALPLFSQQAVAQLDAGQAYGPWSIEFLPGGPASVKKLAAAEKLLAPASHFGVSFWFRAAEQQHGTVMLLALGKVEEAAGRVIVLDEGRPGFAGSGANKSVIESAAKRLDDGAWHNVALSSDGAQMKLYADGVLVSEARSVAAELDQRLVIAPRSEKTMAFGGWVAYLELFRHELALQDVVAGFAARPDFRLPVYENATPYWGVETRGQAGYSTPQDPMTLPHAHVPAQKPTAKPLADEELHARLVGAGPWAIRGGWQLMAAPEVSGDGVQLSTAGYKAESWYAATVPGTVLTTLIDRGVYPDPDYGLNNLVIPESLAHQQYWYRVEFATPSGSEQKQMTLRFEGINYAAEVWLNGHRLGAIKGAFVRGNFDVTSLLRHDGANALAVLVAPPPHPGIAEEESIKAGPGENGGMEVLDGPTFSAAEGWDWIPGIRDRDTGLWQDVMLAASGVVHVGDVNVITTLPHNDASEADVELEVPLFNASAQMVEGELRAGFDEVAIARKVTLRPGENLVRLEPAEYAALKVQHPRLWWPNGYGEPALHRLRVSFNVHGAESGAQQVDFGMREVSYELSLLDAKGHLRRVEVLPARTHDEALPLINERHEGIRQIMDSTPDRLPDEPGYETEEKRTFVHTLALDAEKSSSVRAVTEPWTGSDLVIKVNGVRIAARGGNWGTDDSRKRVSLEHLEPYFRLHRDAHVNMIRNWMGQNTEENFYALADKYGLMVWNDFWESTQNYNIEAEDPALFLTNAQDTILHYRHHPSIVVWCGRNEGVPQPVLNEGLAELLRTLDHTRYYTGSSNNVNLRNSGPYQLKDLVSYYKRNRGFSVELGIPSVPTLEGMKAFMPESERWPISDTWAYHDWHQMAGGDVKPFMQHLEEEFGAAEGFEDFERKAQMIDYAAYRAIFEGFAAHLWQPNAGRLLWMTQPAWPSMEWNILGSDYDTQSSFYGTQKACEPVHVQLDLESNAVDLINLGAASEYTVQMRVRSLDGRVLAERIKKVHAVADARTAVDVLAPGELAQGHAVLIELRAEDTAGRLVSSNVYWWAEQEKTLRELGAMQKVKLMQSVTNTSMHGAEQRIAVHLKNESRTPALLVKLTLKNAANDERILPAYYSENYFSLMPGEEREVMIDAPLSKTKSVIALRGWNIVEGSVAVE